MTPELLIDHPAITELAFFPNGDSLAEPTFVTCEGAQLACHYSEVDPNACTVVFFHGNGESVSDYVQILPKVFAIVGCNTFLAEYRGYGDSTGKPALSTLFPDCARILASLPTRRDRLIFFGRSMGCVQAAAAAGMIPDAKGLILESGLDDLCTYFMQGLSRYFISPATALGLNTEQEAANKLQQEVELHCDIGASLARFRGAASVTCSRRDTGQRRDASERLYEQLRCPKKMIRFENCGHNDALRMNLMTYCELVRDMAEGTFRSD